MEECEWWPECEALEGMRVERGEYKKKVLPRKLEKKVASGTMLSDDTPSHIHFIELGFREKLVAV